MTSTPSAAAMLARAGFEPLPTREGCFTLKSLSAAEVLAAAEVLRGTEGLCLSIEAFDDCEEPVGDLVVLADDGFPAWARLPRGEGYHLTVFSG